MSKPLSTYDVRVTERHIRKGILTQEELDAHLKALPDRIEAGVKMETGDELDPEEFQAPPEKPAAAKKK
jgi:hypothetical protein